MVVSKKQEYKMKKLFLFITFVIFGINVNAQNLQRGGYNDGKIFAYIEQRKGTVTSYYGDGRMDNLIIENLTENDITLQYCFRTVKLDENKNFEQDKMVYENKTLKSREKISENGRAAHNGKIGSYYVDSFAIMNVAVKSNPPSSLTPQNNIPQQNNNNSITLPKDLLGTWYGKGARRALTFIITNNQFQATYSDGESFSGSIYNITVISNTSNATKAQYPNGWNIEIKITSSEGGFNYNVGDEAHFNLFLNSTKNKLLVDKDNPTQVLDKL